MTTHLRGVQNLEEEEARLLTHDRHFVDMECTPVDLVLLGLSSGQGVTPTKVKATLQSMRRRTDAMATELKLALEQMRRMSWPDARLWCTATWSKCLTLQTLRIELARSQQAPILAVDLTDPVRTTILDHVRGVAAHVPLTVVHAPAHNRQPAYHMDAFMPEPRTGRVRLRIYMERSVLDTAMRDRAFGGLASDMEHTLRKNLNATCTALSRIVNLADTFVPALEQIIERQRVMQPPTARTRKRPADTDSPLGPAPKRPRQ